MEVRAAGRSTAKASGEMIENRSFADVYAVVEHPLSPDAIAAAVDEPGAGGIVIFSGVVRNETDGRSVKFLEYEAHAPMAEGKMREIGDAIRDRWRGVKRIAMLHRIGRVIRPLLRVRRAQIVTYLSRAGVVWREDPTNHDLKFLRNRIRHEVLPLL